ncbi:MAG: hypothetical protein KF900_05035 [Bacteroidetes bacterium]|nr:hypothetical protein [Bacteroidota bacterium]
MMRILSLAFIIVLLTPCHSRAQNTKLFYDDSGVQGIVKYSGVWQDTTLPNNGKFELSWRSFNDEKLNTYKASGNIKNHVPSGKWIWEQANWDYSIQPGKELKPELNLRGERKYWDAGFNNGKAQGLWKFGIDSLPLSSSNAKKERLQITANYENGALSGKFLIRSKLPQNSFSASGECNKQGAAQGTWVFENTTENFRQIERRTYENGILIELVSLNIQGSDTIKHQQKFEETTAKLNVLKSGGTAQNFEIGERTFTSDGYETEAKKKFLDYFEDNFLQGWDLPVFKANIVRQAPLFRKINYPISPSESQALTNLKALNDSLRAKTALRETYKNIRLNRGRSPELDVAIEFLDVVKRRVAITDSVIESTQQPLFTYINRFRENDLNLAPLLNSDSAVKSSFYKEAFVFFPHYKFRADNGGIFASLYNYLQELDSLGQVHFLEIDHSYQRLQKEGELLALENLMAERLTVLDSVYEKAEGLAETVHQNWASDYIRKQFQSYSNQDDFSKAKELAKSILGKMDTLLLWQKDWKKMDSFPIYLLDHYTVFEYNPYNGKHDIEIRIKRRFYNKVSSLVLPWATDDFISEKHWETFVIKKQQLEQAHSCLLLFAKQSDKPAKRFEKRVRKEKSPDKVFKLLVGHCAG